MRYAEEDEEETPGLRRLRWMVMALTAVLMIGILAIAGTIVIRLGFGAAGTAVSASGPVSAETLTVPQGEVLGIGQGGGTVLFLVRGADGVQRLYVFDAAKGGAPVSESVVERR